MESTGGTQRLVLSYSREVCETEGYRLISGSATSPDALYIYDSIDAANEILQICLRLGQMGVLQNLPSRYLINFVYGGVFALKAGYSGASSKKDMLKCVPERTPADAQDERDCRPCLRIIGLMQPGSRPPRIKIRRNAPDASQEA